MGELDSDSTRSAPTVAHDGDFGAGALQLSHGVHLPRR
jgi:hypothetical protein